MSKMVVWLKYLDTLTIYYHILKFEDVHFHYRDQTWFLMH